MTQPKEIVNEIVLRPRFKIELDYPIHIALGLFGEAKKNTEKFIVQCIDDHVFIKIPKEKQHFWSPQLDLEIIDKLDRTCVVHGLFGPKPSVWTLFMFIHFLVATLFIGMGVWAYSNLSLNNPYALQVTIMGLMILIWVVLYFAGRMGKEAGRKEMIQLHDFMKSTLKI